VDSNNGRDGAKDDEDQEEDQNNMAAQGFLRLLDQLRAILLFLYKQFPRHPIWRDPLFI
jgi:hypothetical protein